MRSDDKTYCWMCENGLAVRTQIETGISDGEWIEVTNRRESTAHTASPESGTWTPINGSEQVILGNLAILADRTPVRGVPATSKAGGTGASSSRRQPNLAVAPKEGRAETHSATASSESDQAVNIGTEAASLALDELRAELALEIVKVAEADVQAAEARLDESHLNLTRCQADVDAGTRRSSG